MQASVQTSIAHYFLRAIPESNLHTFTGITLDIIVSQHIHVVECIAALAVLSVNCAVLLLFYSYIYIYLSHLWRLVSLRSCPQPPAPVLHPLLCFRACYEEYKCERLETEEKKERKIDGKKKGMKSL